MIGPILALVFTAIATPAPTDITPLSLAVCPTAVQLSKVPYDWKLQQGRGARLKLADSTATCDTGPIPTSLSGGNTDQYHDCRFD